MSTPFFNSNLAGPMSDFVVMKQVQGFKYEVGAMRLGLFDQFLAEQQSSSLVLTAKQLDDYQDTLAKLGEVNRFVLSVVARDFTRYYHQIVPKSSVLETIPFKRPESSKPFIFSEDEINDLMQAARQMGPVNSLRPSVYATLIGLLYTTGLRISEALSLNIGDFHELPYRLFIKDSKFGKDRWVVLKDSVAHALNSYLEVRRRFAPNEPNQSFFLNQKCGATSYPTAWKVFRGLLDQCLIGVNSQGCRPRLHSLRHTFATNCLIRWYRQGVDLNQRLPYLATYMGHRDLASTQIYLHATPQLLEIASQRFHDYFFSVSSSEEVSHER